MTEHESLVRVALRNAFKHRGRPYPVSEETALHDSLYRLFSSSPPTAITKGGAKLARIVRASLEEQGVIPVPVPKAPSTWEALRAWRETNPTARAIPVFDGGSMCTIYPHPSDNHYFRAWHDLKHLRHNADFSLGGESAVFFASLVEASAVARKIKMPRGGDALWALWSEYAQSLYHEVHGAFPDNQRLFADTFIKEPCRALANRF